MELLLKLLEWIFDFIAKKNPTGQNIQSNNLTIIINIHKD